MVAVPNVFSYYCDYNGSPSVFIHVLCFISSTRSTAAGRLAARMLAVVNHVDEVPAGGSRALRPRLYEGLSTVHWLVVDSY